MKLSRDDLIKRYRTDIKSAQGMIAMATVLSLIFIIEVLFHAALISFSAQR